MIPNIYFETEQEFIEQMYVNAYVINLRILEAIELGIVLNELDPIIAYLNDDYELRLEHTDWINNLERVLEYFEEMEEYNRCTSIVKLSKKVKTFLGKDLVN